jgi:hypothetical protein
VARHLGSSITREILLEPSSSHVRLVDYGWLERICSPPCLFELALLPDPRLVRPHFLRGFVLPRHGPVPFRVPPD